MNKRLKITSPKSHIKSSVLSATLMGLALSSISIITEAAEYNKGIKPTYTLKIVTHGEVGNRSDNMSEVNRQDNRRADVKMRTQVQNGTRVIEEEFSQQVEVKVSDAVNRSIRLKDGGVIWVTKDPATINPTLNVVSNSTVELINGKLNSPINFEIKTNYADYIDTWELNVYESIDEDRINPLVTFMGKDLDYGRTIKWDGKKKDGRIIESGDRLQYVLTVRDQKGHLDETRPHQIDIVGADRLITDSQVININSAENDLAKQTIPVYGSRVRIYGRDIEAGNTIRIDNNDITVSDGKFVVEKLLPDGKHNFDVSISDNNRNIHKKAIGVELDSKYMFMVGLADVTIGEGKVTGNLESLSDGDKHLDGDIFVDGRLAFYLKGKIKGKYLITGQMDTGTSEIEDLFDDIHKKDARSLFRRLDPDKYYPVYGDDSTLIDDTDSQGKMYVRVDWDKSRALWGNYNTDMTGTELSSFNRSLYGAKLNHKSTKTTKDGDHKTDVTVFASEAQSAFRHNQFLGTGGSLYYLKDNDIVDGSEKVWIEVRQRESDRSVKKVVLEEGRDYEIDDFQGRIILHRPLLQIVEQSSPSLIKDTPLDGDQVFLMVDYEYVPNGFDSDNGSYGTRGKVWLNDNIALGGTYVHEDRDDNDYDLKGIDVTLKKGKGTYIKGEYTESESAQTQGSFLSDDGGLNFSEFNDNNTSTDKSGSAYSIEARANLKEIGSKEGSIAAWYKNREAGFSSARFDNGIDTVDAGAEAIVKLSDKFDLSAKATLLDKEDVIETTTASLQGDYKVNDQFTLSAEVRHIKEDDKVDESKDGDGTLAAFKVGYDLNKDVNLYVIAQGTLAKNGAYEDNNLITIGTKARVNSKLEINAELSTGDRGDAALLGANYQLSNDYSVYTNYQLSTDTTYDKRSAFTVGQRKTVSNQLRVYTEHQFTHEDRQSGVGQTFGVDYTINKELTANASVQTARLDKAESGLTDRDAFSVGLNYKLDKTEASTRLEYRNDRGSEEDTRQWVTTNRINYRLNPSLRLQGKLNYSETSDQRGNLLDAKFAEAGIGFAYRPIKHDRLNVLGRLTYLYDLQPLSQSMEVDEKSLIASLESTYQLNQKWEIGGKLAHKAGEIRADRNAGDWERNDATLAAARLRYHLTSKWDAMAEYRWMNSKESKDTTHGALVAIDRHVGKNIKIGIGYNFTKFNDDLSDTDGDAKGWFINLVGKF